MDAAGANKCVAHDLVIRVVSPVGFHRRTSFALVGGKVGMHNFEPLAALPGNGAGGAETAAAAAGSRLGSGLGTPTSGPGTPTAAALFGGSGGGLSQSPAGSRPHTPVTPRGGGCPGAGASAAGGGGLLRLPSPLLSPTEAALAARGGGGGLSRPPTPGAPGTPGTPGTPSAPGRAPGTPAVTPVKPRRTGPQIAAAKDLDEIADMYSRATLRGHAGR